MEFSLECQSNGIQPIIGCNIFLTDQNFTNGYLLLIAKNKVGYRNLSRLVSISYLDNNNFSNPTVSFNKLIKYSSGIVCLAGENLDLLQKNFFSGVVYKTDEAVIKFKRNF